MNPRGHLFSCVVIFGFFLCLTQDALARCGGKPPGSSSCPHPISITPPVTLLELSVTTLEKFRRERSPLSSRLDSAASSAIARLEDEDLNKGAVWFTYAPKHGIQKMTDCGLYQFKGQNTIELAKKLQSISSDPSDCDEEIFAFWNFLRVGQDLNREMRKRGLTDASYQDLPKELQLEIAQQSDYLRTQLGAIFHGLELNELPSQAFYSIGFRWPIYEVKKDDTYAKIASNFSGGKHNYGKLWKLNQSFVEKIKTSGGYLRGSRVSYFALKSGQGEQYKAFGFDIGDEQRFITNVPDPNELHPGDRIVIPPLVSGWVNVLVTMGVERLTAEIYGDPKFTPLVDEYCGYMAEFVQVEKLYCILPIFEGQDFVAMRYLRYLSGDEIPQ